MASAKFVRFDRDSRHLGGQRAVGLGQVPHCRPDREGQLFFRACTPTGSVHANRTSGATTQIKCNPTRKWKVIVDHHSNRCTVLRIRYHYQRSKRQCAMRGRIPAGIKRLATRDPPPRCINRSRLHAVPNTSRGVWTTQRTRRSPDRELARMTRLATPERIQRCKKVDAPFRQLQNQPVGIPHMCLFSS